MLDERFEFTGSAKKKLFIILAVGIVLFAIGCIFEATGALETDHHAADAVEHSEAGAAGSHASGAGGHGEASQHGEKSWTLRIISNIWHNNIYFLGIALIGVFFVAFNYIAYAGWSAALIRIPMAFGAWIPIAGVLIIISYILFNHDIFHWTHDYLYDESSPHFDEIIASKQWWLNDGFYWARMIAYVILWTLLWWVIRKNSLLEDDHNDLKYHEKIKTWCGVFIVIFGITSSTAAWDWVMSIDTHFFSTMFGWYVFASWFVTGLAAITLTVLLLRDAGYLKVLNSSHLHDLGKFMFAFSIFWTYIWFAQFLLIYYANIPEESVYFVQRIEEDVYSPIFFFNLIINFLFPFLILMTALAKRQALILKVVAVIILVGHWFDFYLMITPGILQQDGGFDFNFLFMEAGMFMIYLSLFLLTTLTMLSKAKLIPKNHPMMQESTHHHIYL